MKGLGDRNYSQIQFELSALFYAKKIGIGEFWK